MNPDWMFRRCDGYLVRYRRLFDYDTYTESLIVEAAARFYNGEVTL